MNTKYSRTQLALAMGVSALSLGLAAPAHAVGFDKDGWSASFDGNLSAFYVDTKNDIVAGAANSDSESRFMSGFNPTKFNAHFTAPSYNGLKVTGNFQYATDIANTTKSGVSGTGAGQKVGDVRVLDMNVAGDFGTISIGRSWSIFSGSAIVADQGSGSGVGSLCFGSGAAGVGTGGGTCGRIGSGYTWTHFAARLEYDTPDMGGFSARIGLFDPGQPGGAVTFQTKTPRIEAEGSFAGKFDGGGYKFWFGGLHQSLGALAGGPSSKLSGWDTGARVDIGGFGLTAAYTKTNGFGAAGFKFAGIACTATACAESDDKQAYVDASFKVGQTRFGASTGYGKQAANAPFGIAQLKNTHNMLYLHHDLTPQTRLTVEFDQAKQQTASVTNGKYSLFTAGLLFNF